MRQFAEERIAPNAAEVDREAEFPWKSFEACCEMELPSLGIPEAYGGAGADMVTQAIVRRGAGPGLCLHLADHPHLQARDDARHELGERGAQAAATSRGGHRRDPGQLLPLGGRRRQRRGRHAGPGRARRGRLHPHRLEVLDHQRRHLRRLHRLRQDGPRRGRAAGSRASWSSGTGASPSPSTRTSSACGAAPPARSSSTRCGCRLRTASAKRARASPSPCTPWTAAAPTSGPRRSASPRAPSTTPPRT